jgi:hypothetical protein
MPRKLVRPTSPRSASRRQASPLLAPVNTLLAAKVRRITRKISSQMRSTRDEFDDVMSRDDARTGRVTPDSDVRLLVGRRDADTAHIEAPNTVEGGAPPTTRASDLEGFHTPDHVRLGAALYQTPEVVLRAPGIIG